MASMELAFAEEVSTELAAGTAASLGMVVVGAVAASPGAVVVGALAL